MNVKRVLPVLLLLAGFAVPLQAQAPLPVQVICVKGKGTYKPTCSHFKQAVNASPQFKQARNGNRYVVILFAETGQIRSGDDDIHLSITVAAAISDLLSHRFPYLIVSIPWVMSPSGSRALAEAFLVEGLPLAVDAFSDVVDEINLYGTLGRELSEATGDDTLEERMKLEMHKFLKEQTNK